MTDMLYNRFVILFPGTERPETRVALNQVRKMITEYFLFEQDRCLRGRTIAHSLSQLNAIRCKMEPTPPSISKTYHASMTVLYHAESRSCSLWTSTSQPGTDTRPTSKSADARLVMRQFVRVRKLAFLTKEAMTSAFANIMAKAIKL